MLKCTVCLADNDDFAITCTSCKAFLQNRVPNLDLFDIGWKILESPRKAFRTITIADHKNYALFLFSLFGISLSFTGFWFFRLGTRFISLIDLIPAAVGSGVILGLAASLVVTGIYHAFVKILGGKTGFRTSLGVLGYSFTPIALSLFFVLPIELLTFGMYLFTSNPHPYTIKPVSFMILIGFDGLVGVWSLLLAVLGTQVSQKIGAFKSVIAVLGAFAAFLGCLLFLAQRFRLTDLV